MISMQQRFAQELFSPERHAQVLDGMARELGQRIEFRVMEAPAFCPVSLRDAIAKAACELVKQCVTPEYRTQSAKALQQEYTVQGESDHPLFAVVDFAVSQMNGQLVPQLVELQGFPSLFAYQMVLSDWMHRVYSLDSSLSPLFRDMHRDDYLHLFHDVVLAGHSADNVALLEFDPYAQKTLPDFLATRNFIGVEPTDIRTVRREGRSLFHERHGVSVPLQRIYNRAIVDELEEQRVQLPFHWNDSLDVEWAGHPNWYFRMSKYSLPYLHHASVPRTVFLSDLTHIPTDLDRYVLKPLYAFAGKGVNVSPTAADIEVVPEAERGVWVLMEKIDYAECLYTPEGMNKLEIRCMIIWPDNEAEPIPTINLVRSGRGAMMGARYNTVAWSGATIAFFGE